LNDIIIGKNKGDTGHQVGENALLGGVRNFWRMGWSEMPKFIRVKKKCWFGQDLQGFFV
jgi:hypothetical protein